MLGFGLFIDFIFVICYKISKSFNKESWVSVMNCSNCNKINPENSSFCNHCGTSLSNQANGFPSQAPYSHDEQSQQVYPPLYPSRKKQSSSKTILIIALVSGFVLLFLLVAGFFIARIFLNLKSDVNDLQAIAEHTETIDNAEIEEDTSQQVTVDERASNYYIPAPVYEDGFFNNEGLIFPDSYLRYLNRYEIESRAVNYTYSEKDSLQFMINEMYARRGARFVNSRNQNHYNQYSWYRNLEKYELESLTPYFNKYEAANMDLIVKIMKEKGYR